MNRLDELKNERKALLTKNWWLVACVIIFGVSGLLSGIRSLNVVAALMNFLSGVVLGGFLPYFFKTLAFSIKESVKEGIDKKDAETAVFFWFGMFVVLFFKSIFWAIRDVFQLAKEFVVLTVEINKLQKEITLD